MLAAACCCCGPAACLLVLTDPPSGATPLSPTYSGASAGFVAAQLLRRSKDGRSCCGASSGQYVAAQLLHRVIRSAYCSATAGPVFAFMHGREKMKLIAADAAPAMLQRTIESLKKVIDNAHKVKIFAILHPSMQFRTTFYPLHGDRKHEKRNR